MANKVKYNKKPLIIFLSLALACVLAVVLCIVIPKLTVSNDSPVQISQKLDMHYYSNGQYVLSGKLKNVSDKTVTIKNSGGMRISFDDSDDTFTNYWYEDGRDIVLKPNEEYDFDNCGWALDGKCNITKFTVNIDGTTYTLIGGDGAGSVWAFLFGIFALIFLILAITSGVNEKKRGQRRVGVNALSVRMGENCVALSGSYTDKNEAAKNTTMVILFGWLGALLSGNKGNNTQADYVLSDKALYLIKNQGKEVTPADILHIKREDFPVKDIVIKKNAVIMSHVNGNNVITIFKEKDCPLTLEEISKRLNDIFVNFTAADSSKINAEGADKAKVQPTPAADDPFEELKQNEVAASETAEETSTEATEQHNEETTTEATEETSEGDATATSDQNDDEGKN